MPQTSGQDSLLSFQLSNTSDGSYTYTLNVAIPQSLNEHYQGLSHLCWFDFNYAKFVTPYAVKPIADCLRQLYTDDETFTNQVLTLVHQIPYEITGPVYYPAETLAMNKGDCDLFSLIAASILKAGDLDVVLFRYLNESHMNIGVHLTQEPHNTRTPVYSAKFENTTYYVAECTSTDWQNSWRVGECPKSLQNASVVIISTKQCEQTSPAQVAASFENMEQISPPIITPPTFTPVPLPTNPNVPIPEPSSVPSSPPPDPRFTPAPTPANPSPRPEETSPSNPTATPNPTPTATTSPSPSPSPTQEPIQTPSPTETLTPTSTPFPTTDTSRDPVSTYTPATTPTSTIEPAYPPTGSPQLTQQQDTASGTAYILSIIGITTAIITVIFLKKTKQPPRDNSKF